MTSRGHWSAQISLKEGFVLTVASWVVTCLVAAIPFFFFGGDLGLVDAWFEAVSGLTTTGSTVLVGLDRMPPGILLWRSITQWIGGVGIVVMALIMLPFLRVGGMQLFRTEGSERSDKFVPRATELVSLIAVTYLALTVLCTLAYRSAGMTTFDALNHAMTTVATSGFSTRDLSLGYYDNVAVHWVAIVFMLTSSLPLVVYIKAVRTRSLSPFGDEQVVGFAKIATAFVVCLTLWYWWTWDVSLAEALRIVAFNTVSVLSTTGYAVGDYTLWGAGAAGIFFLLMFLGGCTGSTTGGIKTFRLLVMHKTARAYIGRLMSPNRVVVSTFNDRHVTPDIATSVLAYVTVMFASVMAFTLVLSLFDLDFVTSLSGAVTALANVGPGLGPIIGPAGSFAPLPDGAKLLLTLGMLLGRLEFFTLLVLLNRDFWR
jgi:trk system potassium uptake protein TrkH